MIERPGIRPEAVTRGLEAARAVDNGSEPARTVRLTPLDGVEPRPVRWLWNGRLPLGTLALVAGREGIGKSTFAYDLAARVTRGDLPGVFEGQPKGVLIAATEDSYAFTIVPRLMAAGADRSECYRVDVVTSEGFEGELSLPADIPQLERLALEVDAALLILDPLVSRLSTNLDTHKDAEVRQALEPLAGLAERAGLVVPGIIHVSKSPSTDPLTLITGSRAFGAVARAVFFAMRDPEDDHHYLLGQPKNNLGRSDLPTLCYAIEETRVAETDEGPVFTARIAWQGESDRDVRDALEATSRGETRSKVEEATDWLGEYMESKGGFDLSEKVKVAGKRDGHSVSTLKRARQRLKVRAEPVGFPKRTYWAMPGVEVPDELPEE